MSNKVWPLPYDSTVLHLAEQFVDDEEDLTAEEKKQAAHELAQFIQQQVEGEVYAITNRIRKYRKPPNVRWTRNWI